MIERFNFYDVYGYFLPGLVFLALLWLPIGITREFWPGKEITSAIAVLAFAYILGHILQTVAQSALPSKGKDSKGRLRYPSDYFLDVDDRTFTTEFKHQLESVVQSLFHISLNVSRPIPEEEIKRISMARQDAFRLARNALLSSDTKSYGEQFQGLYALMRGLVIAFWIGSAYSLGWALCSALVRRVQCVAIFGAVAFTIAIVLGFVLAFRSSDSKTRTTVDRITFLCLLVAFSAFGVKLGSYAVVSGVHLVAFAVIAAACVWCGARCFSAYKHFAGEFARTTWNDFLSHRVSSGQPTSLT